VTTVGYGDAVPKDTTENVLAAFLLLEHIATRFEVLEADAQAAARGPNLARRSCGRAG
jgi:hypothetical protein